MTKKQSQSAPRLPPISETINHNSPGASKLMAPQDQSDAMMASELKQLKLPEYFKALPLFITITALINLVSFARSGEFSPWAATTISLISMVILAEIRFFYAERSEMQTIFAKGNIPYLKSKHPITGDLLHLVFHPIMFKLVETYHKLLGKTYGIFYGPDPMALSIDLELLQRVFVSDGDKNIVIAQMRFPGMSEFGKSLIQVQSEEWRRMRQAMNPSFSHNQMKSDNVFRDIENTCVKLLQCIDGYPLSDSSGCDNGRIVDVLYDFKRYTIEIIFRVAFGVEDRINFEPGSKDQVLEALGSAAGRKPNPFAIVCVMFNGLEHLFDYFIQFTSTGKYLKLIRSVLNESLMKRRKYAEDLLGSGNKLPLSAPSRKMIDSLIKLVDDGKMDEESLRANLFFIFAAGFDTIAHTLAILCWLLARNTHIQDKLRQAIKASGGEEIPYLEWCIQETIRLYPPVPAGVGRVLSEDITVAEGQTLFKGTTLIADVYSIHHWDEYWGPDVEQFRPERFSEPLSHPLQYFAFGVGPRSCIGKCLAMAEMRAIISHIILKYRIEPCASTPDRIAFSAPNITHLVIEGSVDLKFIELDE